MAWYAVLEEKGLLDWSNKLWGHPKRGGAITASTGSLGHGMPMAVGMALAKKIKGEKGRVFCLIGDGECNEGTIWENALIAHHHKLDNLTLIVDQNHSSDRAIDMGNIEEKFKAFSWTTTEQEGHNHDVLESILQSQGIENPFVLIARTIKGNGVPFMQENSWHNRKLTQQDYDKAILYQ